MEVHRWIQSNCGNHHERAQREGGEQVQLGAHQVQHLAAGERALVDADAAADLRQD